MTTISYSGASEPLSNALEVKHESEVSDAAFLPGMEPATAEQTAQRDLEFAPKLEPEPPSHLDGGGGDYHFQVMSKTRRLSLAPLVLASADLAVWVATFTLLAAFNSALHSNTGTFWWVFVVPMIISGLALQAAGAYSIRTRLLSSSYASQHALAVITAVIAAGFATFLGSAFIIGLRLVALPIVILVLIFGVLVLFLRRILASRWLVELADHQILVLGSGLVAQKFYELCQKTKQTPNTLFPELHGLPPASLASSRFSPSTNTEINKGNGNTRDKDSASVLFPITKNLKRDDWKLFLDSLPVRCDGLIIAMERADVTAELAKRLTEIHFSGLPVFSIEAFVADYWKIIDIDFAGPYWIFRHRFKLDTHPVFDTVKQVVEFGFALLVLLVALPLMICIAIAVVITSGFPIFYKQPRAGKHGRSFMVYKFRTMRTGSDKGDSYTREGDSRITPLGTWLRKLRFDELPQAINVLRGDMRIIGPRAEWIKLVQKYETEIPEYHLRHLVRPGITGWAQVNYPYGESIEDARQKLKYDLYYLCNRSLLLDAEIILKTLYVIIARHGR